MDKPFSYQIYMQGRRYYQQGSIQNVNISNNKVKANAIDQKLYEVKLVFNPMNRLVTKTCTCDYARQYSECKHMAALYLKVINEDLLTEQTQSLIDYYNAYISTRLRPKQRDYLQFEYITRKHLVSFEKTKQIEKIEKYCEDLDYITYNPSRKKEFISIFEDTIENVMMVGDEQSQQLEKWIIQCIKTNKCHDLHELFLHVIEDRSSDEIVAICEEILMCENKLSNQTIASQLLLLAYHHQNIETDEFIKKYSQYEQSEAIWIIRAKELVKQKEYSEVILHVNRFFKHFRQTSFSEEMYEILRLAQIGNDPLEYLNSYLRNLDRWNPNFDELLSIKALLKDEWDDIYFEVYDRIRKVVMNHLFERFIKENNEWEYAVYLIYQESNETHLFDYYHLIESNNSEIIHSLILEYAIKNLGYQCTNAYSKFYLERFQHIIQGLDQSVREHLLYHLKKYYCNHNQVLQFLDTLEVEDEN